MRLDRAVQITTHTIVHTQPAIGTRGHKRRAIRRIRYIMHKTRMVRQSARVLERHARIEQNMGVVRTCRGPERPLCTHRDGIHRLAVSIQLAHTRACIHQKRMGILFAALAHHENPLALAIPL